MWSWLLMGPGALSADTPCGSIGGSARYVVGVCGFNSEAGSARYQPKAGMAAPLRGLSCLSSSSHPCPVPMPSALCCGFSALVFASLGVRTLSKIAARASGRRARRARPLREREPTSTSGGRKGEAQGAPRDCRGRERKNRAGRKPKGTTGRERANPSRPLQSRGAGPAAGGGKPEPPTTTTSNRGGRGWRRIGPRAQNPPRGATGRAAPRGRAAR